MRDGSLFVKMTKQMRAYALSLMLFLTFVFSCRADLVQNPLSSGTKDVEMNTTDDQAEESNPSGTPSYEAYQKNTAGQSYATASVPMSGQRDITVKPGMVLTYTADVPQDGLYHLQLKYTSMERSDLEFSLVLNGAIPFQEAEHLEFPSQWQNSTVKRHDGKGNEIAPEQELYNKEVTVVARDYTGANALPYVFALTKGVNNVQLSVLQGTVQLMDISWIAPEPMSPYQAPNTTAKTMKTIVIEGEDASLKSGRSLIPLSDGSSANVYPADPVKGRLNYIGGSNWKKSGDTLTWEFFVDEAGYYSFGAQYRQNIELGEASYRHLMIDGKTPFEEASRIKFTYCPTWRYYSFGNGSSPYLFYLDKGNHTLSLLVTPGDMAKPYAELREITSNLGDLYVDITMLVGETVDIYRSYELFRQIPNFNERLKQNIDALQKLSAEIEKLQEKSSGSMVSTLNHAAEILKQMLDNPYSAHKYKSAFYTAYTNLGALMGTMTDMPLDIDRIFLVGSDAEQPDTSVPYFQKLAFQMKRFVSTFQADYNAVSNISDDGDSLTLWVNWGRDQAQVLNALIEDTFTQKYGIGVKVEVVNATLIQGILAGKGPDCMLHMSRTEPVNLAMRGALWDLQSFSDYDQVIDQFVDDGVIPYTYNHRVYALPDTQSFNMLFVRTDILNDMGLSIPTTWDEFAYVTTMLQRQNFQIYMPQSLYPTFLLQNHLPLYDEEQGISRLTGPEQIRCFISYTNWFTKYKVAKTMDSFFNRFRIGSVPMGIYDFTMLTQLETAAPEIEGRWTVTSLPGTVNEDGSITRISSGSGTGCAITKLTKSPEKAWSFLKWWVSAETQYSYSSNLESIIGPLGRVSTANIQAFSELGWNRELLPQLLEQQKQVCNLPELPGGYYVYRSIDQAFWNVVEQNANPNDTMQKWGVVADREMLRKKAEYENQ